MKKKFEILDEVIYTPTGEIFVITGYYGMYMWFVEELETGRKIGAINEELLKKKKGGEK